ncbi:MAG: hypothetical protein KQA41_00240 [Candidatus Aenigmarchaeota archaeon]|nr:hypothetical protein [Candidatus Aenigmarchaeota archaeon]MBU5688645.1 hypothetical protein [Candidatus Aenigmarchaeota archaeon]
MVNPFKVLVERMAETGIYDFLLPMIVFWALMYGLLRKSKIFGDSEPIYALLTFVFSLFIWGYAATLPEMSIGKPMSIFTAQFFIIALVFLFAFLGASIAYPDFVDALNYAFKGSNTMIWIFIVIGIIIFFVSGMGNILNLQGTIFKGGSGGVILFVLLLFLGLAIAVTSVMPPRK